MNDEREMYILGAGHSFHHMLIPIAVSDDMEILKAIKFAVRSGEIIMTDDEDGYTEEWSETADQWSDTIVCITDEIHKGRRLEIHCVPFIARDSP